MKCLPREDIFIEASWCLYVNDLMSILMVGVEWMDLGYDLDGSMSVGGLSYVAESPGLETEAAQFSNPLQNMDVQPADSP